MFHKNQVENAAYRRGYHCVQDDYFEGVLGFERDDALVRVWWRTHTVGTYLDHPRQGRTQLFRRQVDSIGELEEIFDNPRTHTGRGYQRRSQAPTPVARTVPCPGCGRLYKQMSGVVGHFESGSCPSCPGQDRAKEVAYNFARSHDRNGSFTHPQLLLENGGQGGGGWQAYGDNYHCQGCGRNFHALRSLMQHQEARPQCLQYCSSVPRLAFN
mmetsp:Transcript_22829/g.27597  ORF Transcript_22829/g.27597 Transcript_22829/m.27597 type:complete len:213 (-) Transcript_22829:135-773(-)